MNPQSFAKSSGYFIAKNTARNLCWCASLALCIQLASAQTTGTWTGESGATWNTTATNWTGVSGTPWDSTNGTANTATPTKATPVAFAPETGDAAARLKNGACEDDAPPGFTIHPVASMFRESIRHT